VSGVNLYLLGVGWGVGGCGMRRCGEAFIFLEDEGAGVREVLCLYQCRDRASFFGAGHCVGFVVDLQGAV